MGSVLLISPSPWIRVGAKKTLTGSWVPSEFFLISPSPSIRAGAPAGWFLRRSSSRSCFSMNLRTSRCRQSLPLTFFTDFFHVPLVLPYHLPALPDHLPVARHLWRCSAGEHELADAGQGGLRRLKYCTKNGFGMIPRFIFAKKQSTGLEAPLVSWGTMSQPIASNPQGSNSIFWVRRMGSDPSIAYENAN